MRQFRKRPSGLIIWLRGEDSLLLKQESLLNE
jgi:hypothetical protein